MSAGDFDVIGATLPGAPAVAIGRNRFIAWGETNVAADVQDLYRERLDADGHARRVPRRAGAAPTIVPETIAVKGEAPVHARRPDLRHGPLVSDAINANNAASTSESASRRRSSRWRSAGRRSTTTTRRSSAFLRAERGAQLERVHGGAARLRRAVAELRLRRRRRPHRLLRARADPDPRARRRLDARPKAGPATMEWTGWIPFDELPHVFDPPDTLHRHRQPSAAAARISAPRSGSSSPSPTAPADHRAGSSETRGSRRTTSARSRPTRCRCTRRRSAAALDPRPRQRRTSIGRPSTCSGNGTSNRTADSAGAAIFQAWFLASRRRSPATSSARCP